jgi:hypothetical protein
MNMEITGYGHLFQYLFKYIHKGNVECQLINTSLNAFFIIGPDQAKFQVSPDNDEDPNSDSINEIDEYWSGHYLSATEAVWQIFGYNITKKTPSVTALPVHLPNSLHHQCYKCSNSSPTLSKLKHYFTRPTRTFFDEGNQCNF